MSAVANIDAMLQKLPLFERLLIMADLAGERLRPVLYSVDGDSGTVRQILALRPPPNEGPLIVYNAAIPGTGGTAAANVRKVAIDANGTRYVGQAPTTRGVIGTGLPSSWNAPIVVNEANQLVATVDAESNALPTPLRGYFAGVHCSERFAIAIRQQGELWADMIDVAAASEAKTLNVQRNTLVELMNPEDVANVPATATSVNVRIGEVLVTPRDMNGFAIHQGIGFSRVPSASSYLSPRCHIAIARGSRITVRSNHTAGTLRVCFVGRQVYVG